MLLIVVELSTFVIWQSGFQFAPEILKRLSLFFDVRFVSEFFWPDQQVVDKLKAFYPSRDFTLKSEKVREIGGGAGILLVATVPRNKPEEADNSLVKDFKNQYRRSGRNFLHASDNETEAYANFSVATGESQAHFLALKKAPKTLAFLERDSSPNAPKVAQIEKAPVRNIQEAFARLNKYEEYVVLRNWEGFPERPSSVNHSDIDLLVKDRHRAETLLMARPVFLDQRRVYGSVEVGNQLYNFDFRYVGDSYYDMRWQHEMLAARVWHDFFFVLSSRDYFWSLVYHSLVHKGVLSEDYQAKLRAIGAQPNQFLSAYSSYSVENLYHGLRKFLGSGGYRVTRPLDSTVRRSPLIGRPVARALVRVVSDLSRGLGARFYKIDLSYLPILRGVRGSKKARLLKRNVFRVGPLVIKRSDGPGRDFLLRNEFAIMTELENYGWAPKALGIYREGDELFLVSERIPGRALSSIWFFSRAARESLRDQSRQIADDLSQAHIAHRDVSPSNLVFDGQRLCLIDFQFARNFQREIATADSFEKDQLSALLPGVGRSWGYSGRGLKSGDKVALEAVAKASWESSRPLARAWGAVKSLIAFRRPSDAYLPVFNRTNFRRVLGKFSSIGRSLVSLK
jgi:hypothetical protein